VATPADIRLEIRSDPCLLVVVRGVVGEWLATLDIPEAQRQEVVLAIDEACSNAIRHSYGGCVDQLIEVQLRAAPEVLEVEVLDSGRPCPRERVRPRQLKPPRSDELQPGGLGIQLMYRVFDDVSFSERAGGGNRVTMRLRRPKRG
jgi:serine/threonine-protein kinase RsbW/sigma-B regulation protein RsbU (phosphoserine phosphatase)